MTNKRISASCLKLITTLAPVFARIRDWCATNYLALCRNNRRRQQVIAGLACCAALSFFVTVSRMQSATRSLGATVVVLVASHNIEPGDAITSQHFLTRTFVRSSVAPTALHAVQPGLIAQQHISVGELLTTTNSGFNATKQLQLPVGCRSVAIVPPGALPPMHVGDHVDIIANGVVLAADVLVLSLIENTSGPAIGAATGATTGVIVAVPAEFSAAVASAAAIGDATLVVSS